MRLLDKLRGDLPPEGFTELEQAQSVVVAACLALATQSGMPVEDTTDGINWAMRVLVEHQNQNMRMQEQIAHRVLLKANRNN